MHAQALRAHPGTSHLPSESSSRWRPSPSRWTATRRYTSPPLGERVVGDSLMLRETALVECGMCANMRVGYVGTISIVLSDPWCVGYVGRNSAPAALRGVACR
jgi:hypothetical protein